jgi:hypothetical protein
LSLLAVPAMATDFGDGNVGIDVQAYVDGTASYQAGCVDQQSCEIGIRDVCDVSTSGKVTSFDCAAHVPDSSSISFRFDPVDGNQTSCGLDLKQNKWDTSLTTTKTLSLFNDKVDATYAVGMADMNSLGGVALCSTPDCTVTGSATVANSHQIEQSSHAVNCNPGCYATTSYCGSQSLNITAVKAAP